MNKRTTWSDEEVETLKNMYAQGKSDKQIADYLGVQRDRVYAKRNHLKQKNQLEIKKTNTMSEIIKAAKEAGLSYGEYVKQYGV